ncbi:MAG: tetratricopeptide repeat protein [Sulfurihydrogenibium sp.]|jgi:tetratricopeptide (TPR) repeat protein|nr:tetratricopeptide repeat protein [Sulfurihydrogenibium sp.]
MCKRENIKESIILAIGITLILLSLTVSVLVFKKGKEIEALDDKCFSYVNNKQYEDAIKFAYSIPDNKKSSGIYACIATAYYNLHENDLALKNFEKAKEMQEGIFHPLNPTYRIYIYTNIAKILHDENKDNEAIIYYEKALHEMIENRKIREEYRKKYIEVLTQIAKIYEENQALDKAIEYYEKALKLYNKYGFDDKEKEEIKKKLAEIYGKKDA